FQANLVDLANMVKARSDVTKPGSVQVTVPNANEFDGGCIVLLDHTEEHPVQGTQCFFSVVTPGPHELLVRGKKGKRTFEIGSLVRVTADSPSTVTLVLPVN